MRDNRFYIYLHLTEDKKTGYLGKGSFDRVRAYSGRSKEWRKLFGKCPPVVEILEKELTEEQALEAEKFHIARLKDEGVKLINKDTGGSGDSGIKHQKKTCKTLEELLNEKEN